jgi:hypothetical protein
MFHLWWWNIYLYDLRKSFFCEPRQHQINDYSADYNLLGLLHPPAVSARTRLRTSPGMSWRMTIHSCFSRSLLPRWWATLLASLPTWWIEKIILTMRSKGVYFALCVTIHKACTSLYNTNYGRWKFKKVENKNVTSKYGTNGKLNHYLKWAGQLRMEKNSTIKSVEQMHGIRALYLGYPMGHIETPKSARLDEWPSPFRTTELGI